MSKVTYKVRQAEDAIRDAQGRLAEINLLAHQGKADHGGAVDELTSFLQQWCHKNRLLKYKIEK